MRLDLIQFRFFLLLTLLFSCSVKEFPEERLFDKEVHATYSGEKDLYKWENMITINDTAFIQSFFDTLYFNINETINAITYTWFNDNTNASFNVERYIRNEKATISNTFKLSKYGTYEQNSVRYFWFLVNDNENTTYIEYIFTNPVKIKSLSTSVDTNYLVELKLLNDVSSQFIYPRSPNAYKEI